MIVVEIGSRSEGWGSKRAGVGRKDSGDSDDESPPTLGRRPVEYGGAVMHHSENLRLGPHTSFSISCSRSRSRTLNCLEVQLLGRCLRMSSNCLRHLRHSWIRLGEFAGHLIISCLTLFGRDADTSKPSGCRS